MTIYVDLLICYNLLVHFCLLSSTAAVCGERVRLGRLLGGCLFGSASSFLIFFRLRPWELAGIKALLAVLLTLLTFGFSSGRIFARKLLVFLAVNFVYAGGMYAVNEIVKPPGLTYQNGVAYFAAETGSYLVGIMLCYLLLRFGIWVFVKHDSAEKEYPLYLRLGEHEVRCKAFYDSGNHLCDLYTGKPVVILSPKIAEQLLPKELLTAPTAKAMREFGHKIRLIPCNTVSGSTLMPVFAPDELRIDQRSVPYMAAVSRSEPASGWDALLPAAAKF